jgi:hypothetical protein
LLIIWLKGFANRRGMAFLGINLFAHVISVAGGFVAAAATYYLFGRELCEQEAHVDESLRHSVAEDAKGILDVINRAGVEAFKIAVSAIPMLVLSLVALSIVKALVTCSLEIVR